MYHVSQLDIMKCHADQFYKQAAHINISQPLQSIVKVQHHWNELHLTRHKQGSSFSCVLVDFLYVSRRRHHHLDEICHEI